METKDKLKGRSKRIRPGTINGWVSEDRKKDMSNKVGVRNPNKNVVAAVSSTGAKANQPYISVGVERGKSTNVAGTEAGLGSSFSSGLNLLGSQADSDDFDSMDLLAANLVELLLDGTYSLYNLTKPEKFLVLRYFYRTIPVVGRILDLHTEIPLSKITLQNPAGCTELMKDYVKQFFDRVLKRTKFTEKMVDFVLQYWIYGESYILIDDLYDGSRVLEDLTKIEENQFFVDEVNLEFCNQVDIAYMTDPTKVCLSDRLRYLEIKFGKFIDPDYHGPNRLTPIQFYNIDEYYSNPDIDFEAVRYLLAENVISLSGEELVDLGYSNGFAKLIEENDSGSRSSVLIDNDVFSGLPFLMVFRRFEGASILQRIFDSCLEWESAKRAIKTKVETLGKIGRIVTAEGASESQIDALRVEVEKMMANPNYAIVVNFHIEWDEVNSFLKSELEELISAQDRIVEQISMGLGVPQSLISGDSQYSGDNIKVDILNTQYFAFKVRLQDRLEESFLRPIALRKGFISVDEWGQPKLIYPKITFSLANLRADAYFETLFSLYQKGSLPVSVIFDLLNLDTEDIDRQLLNDLWSIRNDKFNVLVEAVYSNLADGIADNPLIKDKVLKIIGGYKSDLTVEDSDVVEDSDDSTEGAL